LLVPCTVLPAGTAAIRGQLIDAFDEHVPHHAHSMGQMLLYLRLVLHSVLGFRGAASALEVFSPLFPTDELPVSPNGGQMWLLRLGLYELTRAKEQADDWIWILDHTIQVGKAKCFVVTGVRITVLDTKRLEQNSTGALTHQDLSVWQIELVEKSDGPTVERQLVELSQETGCIPRSILSDCGGDLSAGIAEYCATRPQTIAVKDLPHFAANVIKKELNDDPRWTAFLTDANRSKAQLRQTKFAFLLPPDLKSKARWMNLDPLVTWSEKVVNFVNSPRPVPGVLWEGDELEEKMGWIRNHQSSVERWVEMLNIIGIILKYIRKQGYHRKARAELDQELSEIYIADCLTRRVANKILDYVEEQSHLIPEGQHLLATSEALESLLGKAKQLQGQQSKSGFTKMILGIAASVSKLTATSIHTALSTIKGLNVTEWLSDALGTSVQAQRFHALHASNDGTKTG